MEKYVAVLGRQPLISVAELESLFGEVKLVAPFLAEFASDQAPRDLIRRLGGTLKIAEPIKGSLEEFWQRLPEAGKIVLGVSDFGRNARAFTSQKEALRLKKQLVKMGRSVRVIPNKSAVLSSATSLHNRLFTDTHIELLKTGKSYYRVVAVQNIESYVQRDQARPARDAKVGMLPPKLAQILINLAGELPERARLLDPFCGTGVLLQEAALMGYRVYGTDLSERMVQYSEKNLEWLTERMKPKASRKTTKSMGADTKSEPNIPIVAHNDRNVKHELFDRGNFTLAQGDATNYQWETPIDVVACETYLGPPMSQAPAEIKMRQTKQECKSIILGFLKNLAEQIEPGIPVVIAVPAWLRPDGGYERLKILDEIENLRYNVVRFKNLGQKDLLYHRDGQVVAREIIVLRKR